MFETTVRRANIPPACHLHVTSLQADLWLRTTKIPHGATVKAQKNSAPHLIPKPTVHGARVPQHGGLIEATAASHTQRRAASRPNEHAGFLRLPAPCNPRPVLDGGTETSPRHPLEIPFGEMQPVQSAGLLMLQLIMICCIS